MLRPNEGFLAEFLRWRDSDVFTPREKAALALSESISRGDSRKQVERVLKRVRPRFKEGEMIQLLLSIRAIADWHDAHSRRADLRAGDSGQQR